MTTYLLTGIVRDARGAAVPSAVVKVFDTATDTLQGSAIAAGDGAYSVSMTNAGPLYAVGYHANAPDIAGTTLNTLLPVAQGASSHPTYYIYGF